MNIEQAKQIPLPRLVEQLGGRFSHKGARRELWYYSPFRPDERTASFKIDEDKNQWHDFARHQGIDAHGDIPDLWTDYHNLPRRTSDSLKQALAALRQGFGNITPSRRPVSVRITKPKPPRYIIPKPPGSIWIDSLKREVSRRGLTLGLVATYLKQAQIEDTKRGKRYYGFAFLNDKNNWEISIPHPGQGDAFKLAIGPKAITTIPSDTQFNACVFEGFWDMLTWLAMNPNTNPLPTLYSLNSTSMLYELAQSLIARKQSIQRVFLFLDNDKAGRDAETKLLELLEPHNISVGTMNHIYDGQKDLNEWWIQRLENPNVKNLQSAQKSQSLTSNTSPFVR